MKIRLLLCALLINASAGFAAEYVVNQRNDSFSQKVLKIKVGDTVVFKNSDKHFHNVFSLTEDQVFDLGSFSEGQERKYRFDKPGKVEVECAIHATMRLIIEVSK